MTIREENIFPTSKMQSKDKEKKKNEEEEEEERNKNTLNLPPTQITEPSRNPI